MFVYDSQTDNLEALVVSSDALSASGTATQTINQSFKGAINQSMNDSIN